MAALISPAHTQTRPEIISPKPDSVQVTIYRDPARGNGGGMNLNFLNGFAVVTETRRITVPAGPATIRFAGVAEGMVAVSAVIRGLPGGIIEQNRDKKLLSPGSLVDGTLGNRVTLRRTDPATGAVTERDAVIRSGSQGALVVETEAGVEALQCSGLPEKIIYENLPGGLFATPVLSVDTVSPQAATAEVTLTYLAAGFDWNADYVVKLGADGTSLDLFSWLTLANGNAESFADAELLVIAGTLNIRQPMRAIADKPQATPLYIQCWPRGSTARGIFEPPPPPPPPPPMMMAPSAMRAESADAIMVTASRKVEAELEALGDLKLYRVPFRSTVAAKGQKQVKLLGKQNVPARLVYRGSADGSGEEPGPLQIEVRMDNKTATGLGLPLPSGRIAVFDGAGDNGLLIGQGRMRDYAVGQEVKFTIGQSNAVQLASMRTQGTSKSGWDGYRLELTNANPGPVTAEIDLAGLADVDLRKASGRTIRKDGKHVWLVTIPANERVKLTYESRSKYR
ncbi:hypothetical protein [Blastomonas sp.]|uniref:DUF4139 domain-containing protein n=1 Tax=Blastomonas sp. TaxID=1909299 RepID=UPI00262CAA1E|nr:hypothetical protein [Blastomonas sp.]MDM7957702.1 hypothetical protein [Blastomonas sp.]